jgi:hypothetical protein
MQSMSVDISATCRAFPGMNGARVALFQITLTFLVPLVLHLLALGRTPIPWLSTLQQWSHMSPEFVGNFLIAVVTWTYLAAWFFTEIGRLSPASTPLTMPQRVLHVTAVVGLLSFLGSDTADNAWLDAIGLVAMVGFHLVFWSGALFAPRVVTRSLHRELRWFLAVSLVAVPLTGPLSGSGVWKRWLRLRAPDPVRRLTGSLHRFATRSMYVAAALTIESAGRPAAPAVLFSVVALIAVVSETFDLYEAVLDVFLYGSVGVNLIMEEACLLLISYALGESIVLLKPSP